jgi:hypothetical protein
MQVGGGCPGAHLGLIQLGTDRGVCVASQCAGSCHRTGKSDRAVSLLLPYAARVASVAAVQFLAAGVGLALMSCWLRLREPMAAV